MPQIPIYSASESASDLDYEAFLRDLRRGVAKVGELVEVNHPAPRITEEERASFEARVANSARESAVSEVIARRRARLASRVAQGDGELPPNDADRVHRDKGRPVSGDSAA